MQNATSQRLEFGVDCSSLDWSAFEHVTDSEITKALAVQHVGERDRASAYERVRGRFLALLGNAAARKPDSFRAIPGAVELISCLSASNWRAAIATGAWSGHAIALAEEHDSSHFDRIVLVGDASWDVATAATLRLPFLGVGTGARAARLRAFGATSVLPDFMDRAAVINSLDNAGVPGL
jgi:phosphoglycolate phosphatase-like HAD superfamily hydrolase